jgi:hypothetical protein
MLGIRLRENPLVEICQFIGENLISWASKRQATKAGSKHVESIKKDLFPENTVDQGKSANLKPEFLVAFRIIIASIITRGGGTDTISWPHKHMIWFMLHRVKVNLAACLFEHLCLSVVEGHHKSRSMIHHP